MSQVPEPQPAPEPAPASAQDAAVAPAPGPAPEEPGEPPHEPQPEAPPARAPREGFWAVLPVVCRALLMLLVEGASIGLGAALLLRKAEVMDYVLRNDIPARGRTFILIVMLGCGALGALLGLVALVVNRLPARRLDAVARRLLPVALIGLLPLLYRWRTWYGRDLTYLVLALLGGLAARATLEPAFLAPPLWPRLGDRLARARARLAGAWPRLWSRAPFIVVCLGVAVYAVHFSVVTVVHHWNAWSSSFDLAIFDNLMWNVVHGNGPIFKSTPAFGPGSHSHLGSHATFHAYLYAPFYALVPRAETLLVMQATMVAAGAIPLFLVARRRIGEWASVVLAVIYLLYPPQHGANLYDFHWLITTPFFLWMTFWAVEERRPILTVVFVICCLGLREDVSPGIAVIGAYLLLSGERPRAGFVLMLVGGCFFVLIKFIIMPRFGGGGASYLYVYQGLVPKEGGGFGGVLKTVFANPAYTLDTLLTRDKVVYVLHVMVPLLFLPLRRPACAVLLLPGFLFTLIATGYQPVYSITFQYTTHWTSYVFLAAALALPGVVERAGERGSARKKTLLLAMLFAAFAVSYNFGALLQQNTAWGGFGPYRFGTNSEDLDRRKAIAAARAVVPRDARVAASEQLVPQFSNRDHAYTLRMGVFDADYIIFSLALGTSGERPHVDDALRSRKFGVALVQYPLAVLKRGHETSGNADLLKRIGAAPLVDSKTSPLPPMQKP